MVPCLPNNKRQNRTSFIGDELHAFDLTWRNYIPSISQLCCCHRNNRIQLAEDDNDLIEPVYYNDHTLYRGEAIQNYLQNSRDLEFDSVLNQDPSQISTRNPFGHKHKKDKKKKKKKNQLAVMETDLEEDIIGYNIEQQQQQPQYYYNDDAEFLADDQIANLVYQHDEQGNIIQEMQPQRQFYAARTMPNIEFYEEEEEEYIIEEEPSSSQQPLVSVEAAQTLLSNKLDDLTEKLTFIKNNIIQIRPTTEEDDDENYDKTTLHTIHREDQESHSDIDSITSEALDVYEDTNNKQQPQQSRYSTDELHLPSMANFVSDQHPFSYFTDPEHQQQQQQEEQQEDGLNVRNVFDIGRKWLGV